VAYWSGQRIAVAHDLNINPELTRWNMTQKEMIRAHLLQGKSITPFDALTDYGCFRLAARIEQLRKEGLQVKTESETRNGKSYARYTLGAA
jgi:biotin operon repressor